ncbi:nitroreductase family protein [Desulfofalx alkaliphila]|uniref:nitroreductase family protein n=1 Tax=Desulfofalx alkaliphila TaxID=105483 RepID=UPI0004E0DAA0|nr:nitroreductase family protein [Desulfofalx alkaliphila]
MNEVLKTIHSLHTSRDFSERAVSDDDLNTILDAAVRAANASSRQSYSIIVVDDRELMKEYFNYVGSKALVFCVDYNRIVDTAQHLNYEYSCDNISSFISGSTDAALAAQNAVIAARSLGIDSMFTNSLHRGDLSKFYQQFNLPEKYCFPLITLILGYGLEEKRGCKGRLRGPGVIHYGKYQPLTEEQLDQVVDQYNQPENKLGLPFFKPSEDFPNYLDWFFAVWSKPQKSEQFAKMQDKLYATLQKAGFIKEGL